MDPYYQSSSYLNLLNSQEQGGNFGFESFPPCSQNSSQIPFFSSQPSQSSTPLSQEAPVEQTPVEQTPAGRSSRKSWGPADDEVLISAWLNTSKDNIVGNQQKGGCFWQKIGQYYADSPHAINGGEKMGMTHCKQRWHKINEQTNKFCGAMAAAERLNGSGHSENDVLTAAHNIYFADHRKRFNLEHCWRLLRFEQKWLSLNTINTPPSKRKQAQVSEASSSNVDDSEKRPEGIKAAKAKRSNAQATNMKALAEYSSMWDIKKKEMAEAEKLQKLAILDTLLAKKDPLNATEEAIVKTIVSQYF